MDWYSSRAKNERKQKERSAAKDKIAQRILIVSAVVSAISAGLTAWAAWSTATQAQFAQEALTASDRNRAFDTFYDKWSALCEVIDLTDGYVVFDLRGANNLKMIVIDATDMGYTFAPYDHAKQRVEVIKAMDGVVAAHEKLGMWLPYKTMDTMRFEQIMNNLIVFSRVDASEPEARHYNAMLRQAGYCRVWKGWFVAWFKQGYPPTPDIYYKDVRLVFRARNGGVLNEDYIRESRSMPWDEIHRYAPP